MKPYSKLTLTISELGADGDGVAFVNANFPVYVFGTIPGDVVDVEVTEPHKSFARAKLNKIRKFSNLRVKPKCNLFDVCGGCQIQQMDYKAQLIFKNNKVKKNLDSVLLSGDYQMFDTLGCGNVYRFRNKALIPFAKNSDGKIVAGFFAKGSHEIVDCQDCMIGVEENRIIQKIVKEHLIDFNIEPYNEVLHQGVFRYLQIRKAFATNELMVSLIVNSDSIAGETELVNKLVTALPNIKDISILPNKENTNVIKGREFRSVFGNGFITDFIGKIKFKISPLSFYQVNPLQTKVLYSKALEFANLSGNETVFDLYCGVGTISLFLAKSAKKVFGVEIIPQAINDANENAEINGIKNTEFICGKAEEVIPQLIEKQHVTADVVVVDPPRKGCDKSLLETIVMMKPKTMVYVSCDSSTLARDVKILTDNGFELTKVQPVDMFPHSVHIETVAQLKLKM
ncbi:MAG: 23S rRNA (uracil(1939)-C(5))-methyltransferase RlmD [Bacteroidales bacterium]|nr:23S rRNA (uracil(1939)-C(5))-methyltransferase RlmD [Bacteroidales bacterium]